MAGSAAGLEPVATYDAGGAVLSRVAFNASGNRLAVPDQSGTVHVLDALDLSVLDEFTVSPKSLWTAAWSEGGDRLAVAGRDNTVHVFDVARGLRLERTDPVTLSATPTIPEVRALFTALDVPLVMTDSEISQMVEKALHARNPYA